MAVIINGDTGIDKITDGSVVNADIGANEITQDKVASGFPLGKRNLIINGDMRIDQRNAGASVTPSADAYTLDRWIAGMSAGSKFSVEQSTTAPTDFTNSVKITSLAATSLSAGDYYTIEQSIEGYNIAHLNYGSANAKTITLSFWTRSSLTGTFGGSLRGASSTRSYPFTYTISSADTWEYKTVTVSGVTSGTWVVNNGKGLSVIFGLGVGATYSGTAGSWASSNYLSATGATSVVGTSGATWYITGVQLEVGDSASDFEFVPYDMELAKCQRYLPALNGIYWTTIGYNIANNSGVGFIKFPVTARVPATGISYSSLSHFTVANKTNTSYTPTSISFDVSNIEGGSIIFNTSAGLTQGDPSRMYASNSSAQLLFNGCEL